MKIIVYKMACSILLIISGIGLTMAQNPGGVGGARVWFKADAGVYENTGATDEAENNDVVQRWSAEIGHSDITPLGRSHGNPRYRDLGANYNPIILFDGGDMLRNTGGNIWHGRVADNTENTFFLVSNIRNNGVQGGFSQSSSRRAGYFQGAGGQRVDFGNPNQALVGGISIANQYAIAQYQTTTTSSNRRTLTINGVSDVSSASLNSIAGTPFGRFGFGAEPTTNASFSSNMDMAEYIAFPSRLNATDIEKVQTYLAVKYGITLGHNYYASDWNGSTGTTIWTLGGGYDNDIAGIGRDDASSLNQKQSQSESTDAIVSIGLGSIETTNMDNTNVFAADREFLLWGNDNASTALQSTELPAGAIALQRLGREWQVQESGAISNLTLSFDNISISPLALDIELYVDTDGDGDFNNATIITGGVLSGGVVTFSGVDLNDGDVFTLGFTNPSPGGRLDNLVLWLKADESSTFNLSGTNVLGWTDIAKGLNLPSDNAPNHPQFTSGNEDFNYNPSVDFTSASTQLLGVTTDTNLIGIDDPTVSYYAVTKGVNGAGRQVVFIFENGSIGSADSNATGVNGTLGLELNASVYSNDFGVSINGSGANDGTHLTTFVRNNSPGNRISYVDGNQFSSGDIQQNREGNNFENRFSLGANGPNGEAFSGSLAELIIYDEDNTTTEIREKIESYLGVKYGITIAHNYYASDWDGSTGTTLWTLGGGYDNNIAGIGRDDLSGLNQKQSRSVNDDAVVAIGLGSIEVANVANTSTFNNDKDFLLWGNDNASTALQNTELPIGASALQRIGREWQVQETGAINNLTLSFDNISISPLALNMELYVDTDGDGNFSDATVIAGGVLSGGVVTFSGLDLNDGDVFTLGFTNPSPGGREDHLAIWLRADADVTEAGGLVSNWEDQSGNEKHAWQAGGGNQPNVSTRAINYNPALDFDGGTDFMNLAINIFSGGDDDLAFYTVWLSDTNKVSRVVSTGHSTAPSGNTGRGYTVQTIASGNHGLQLENGSFHLASYTVDEPVIATTFTRDLASNDILVASNGETFLAGTFGAGSRNFNAAAGSFIGQRNSNTERFDGLIAEIIGYSQSQSSATERLQIESYLAIKYGVTLDQTTATNYLASDATVLWDATANSIYSNDIAGIGRDDQSALNQKQSKSVNTNAIVSIGLGSVELSNAANANTFIADKDFLLWGADNGGAVTVVNTGIPSAFSEKVNRNWLVNESGSIGNVMVQIPNTAVTGFTSTTDLILFVADDENFTTNVEEIPLVQNGANWEAVHDFNGVKYFTFGLVASGDFMRHGKTFQGGVEQPMKF